MPSKIFCIPLAKFLTTFFSRSPKLFTCFASVVKFHENSLLRCPPSAVSCPGNAIFTSFLVIYLLFVKENWPLGCPQGGCPGPSHRPHPLCTPLPPSARAIFPSSLCSHFHALAYKESCASVGHIAHSKRSA